jgi:formylglycine-generating enzyme required for sulfatase activity
MTTIQQLAPGTRIEIGILRGADRLSLIATLGRQPNFEIQGVNNAPALDPIAWYGGNSSVGYSGDGWDTAGWTEKQYPGGIASYQVVGGKRPNAWGLHDMIGNVFEWCADRYGAYPDGAVSDPLGAFSGTNRVNRGGSWDYVATGCRSANRSSDSPGFRVINLGFRLALSSVQ